MSTVILCSLQLDSFLVISSSTIEYVIIEPGLWGKAYKDISQRAVLLKILHIKLNNCILKGKHIISIAVPELMNELINEWVEP